MYAVSDVLSATAKIVLGVISNSKLPIKAADLPGLICAVGRGFVSDVGVLPSSKPKTSGAPPKGSEKSDFLVCCECNRPLKMLRRHLRTAHGLTPGQYRREHGLAADAPIVAGAYAQLRSKLAKASGLGKRPVHKVRK